MEDRVASDLTEKVQQFEESEHSTRDSRLLAQRDRDYYDEKQLTAEEEASLKKRGQPVVVYNRIKRKVNAMMGIEKQSRKDPKAYPRNPADEDAAKAATDAIRFVCEASRWEDKRSEGAKDLAIEGTCAIMVGVKQGREGPDPDLLRIAWDRLYYDPASSEFDFADAAYMGVVIWMDLDEAVRKYPDAKEALEGTWSRAKDTETYDDKPKFGLWADYKRRRIRVCEHYYKTDGWQFCIFTQAGFVVEPQASPYIGDDGEPECPIKAVSLYIDRDNNRYGEVRTMIGPQDEINKRRSKALHIINTRQVRVSPATGLDPAVIRKELARPDGVFVGDQGDVEVLQTQDMAAANLQMLQEAKNEIDLLGPNAALAGKGGQDQSGRAILAQQQGGMIETATYLDRLRVLSLAVYRSSWARIRQLWTGERWVRVTDNDKNVRFVGINRPITYLQQQAEQMGVTKDNLAQADPQAVQMLEQMAMDPRAQQVATVENAVAELDVDIIVDEGLDTPTIQAEQLDTLTKMLPMLSGRMEDPQFADKVLELVITASQLRDKDKLLEMIKPKEGVDPQAAAQAQQQALQQQVQMQAQMEGQIEMEKAKVKAASDIEVAKIKADADMQIAGVKMEYQSQLDERKATSDANLAERKALLDFEVKSRVGEQTGETAREQAETDKETAYNDAQMAILAQLTQVVSEMSRPKTKVPLRDENGMITGIREVYEDAA